MSAKSRYKYINPSKIREEKSKDTKFKVSYKWRGAKMQSLNGGALVLSLVIGLILVYCFI